MPLPNTINLDGSTNTAWLPDWLLPFQEQDARHLLDRRSILIANEMGTGKTYEAIALDLARRAVVPPTDKTFTPTLVVAPLTILETTWGMHYERLAPHLKVCVIDPKARGKFIRDLQEQASDVYIMHWDALRILAPKNKPGPLKDVVWFHVIADEAHRAKNRKAQQTQSLKSLKTAWKTALTGTPVMNYPQDLWSILNWLYPQQWRGYWDFYEKYVNYKLVYPANYRVPLGPKNEAHLREQIRPYFTRRTKEEVLPDLPEKYYTEIEVELGPKQRKAYDEMKKDMIAWLETQETDAEGLLTPLAAQVVIAQLTRLQQFSIAYAEIEETHTEDGVSRVVNLVDPSAKIDALMQIIEDNPDEPIVIFSRFRKAIALVERRLDAGAIPYVRITGDDSGEDRRHAVDRFQQGSVHVFLGTIGAGSEGITLTRSSTVVFIDRDWTPARNAQAEDRLHRIGQENAVQVIDIMAKRTVDQMHHQKLEMKKEWIRRMIDS